MEYKCKKELDEKYQVEASFYKLDINGEEKQCRRVADIKAKEGTYEKIDAYFVKMNPGGCKPNEEDEIVDDADYKTMILRKVNSDATMVRVMNIMNELGWHYVRMLNVSDIREGKSEEAKRTLRDAINNGQHEHCIFSHERRNELEELTKEDAIYVVACGCSDEVALYFSLYVEEYLKDKTLIGVKNEQGRYKHIKPSVKESQIKIAEDLIKQIKAN
ncbi:MAG: DUF1643 domain-containing protein [Roseburia sp.]|nr:DUF1643 domain-containing protein [Roseburia sp.]